MKFNLPFQLLVISCLAFKSLSGQELPKIVSDHGPAAAVIDKALGVPISKYTGIIDFEIPIYTIEIDGASIPISLSYAGGGGIKVNEEASMTGLGWVLNYGGYVSRSLKGKPDEFGFLEGHTISDFMALPTYEEDISREEATEYMSKVKNPFNYFQFDLRPDEFHYSAGSFSGKFMYQQEGAKFIQLPKQDVLVNYQWDTEVNDKIALWEILTPEGTKYVYGRNGNKEGISSSYKRYTEPFLPEIINMWSINSITGNSGEQIQYHYLSPTYDSFSRSTNESFTLTTPGYGDNPFPSPERTLITDIVPSMISFPEGNVSFISSDRSDIPTKKIDEVIVKNADEKVLKKVKFYYSYFYGNFGYVPQSYRQTDDIDNKRLKLDSVAITDRNNNFEKVYRFSYYENNGILPSKYTYAQDVWGYFNGKENTTWIPKLNQYSISNAADRRVNNDVNNVFMLKTVVHPTGGKTVFQYEGNDVKMGDFSAFDNLLNSDDTNDEMVELRIGNSSPDETAINSNGPGNVVNTYFKTFAVPVDGGYPSPSGWSCSFGATLGDAFPSDANCTYNYALFRLERKQSDNSYQTLEQFEYCHKSGMPPVHSIGMYQLQPGNYRLAIITSFPEEHTLNGSLSGLRTSISWRNSSSADPNTQLAVGGLRIKEITNYDYLDSMAQKKIFKYIDGEGISSGRMYSEPRYLQYFYNEDGSPSSEPSSDHGLKLRIYGSPLQPLKAVNGSYIGYKKVVEQVIDVKNTISTDTLKTEYDYSFFSPVHDAYISPSLFLNGSLENHHWQYGKLLGTNYYKNDELVKNETYTYYNNLNISTDNEYVEDILIDHISYRSLNIVGNNTSDFTDNYLLSMGAEFSRFIYGLKASTNEPGMPEVEAISESLTLPYTKHYSVLDKLTSKTTTYYYDDQQFQQKEIYKYEGVPLHNQITSFEITNSSGEENRQELLYPSNFTSIPLYEKMNNLNMKNQIVEEKKYVDNTLLNVTKTDYREWYNNLILPEKILTSKGSGSLEPRLVYKRYDSFGNPEEIQQVDGPLMVYLWGYGNQYPMAKIENASHTESVNAVSTALALLTPTYATMEELLAGLDDIQGNSAQQARWKNFNTALRSNLSDAMVTTYTYDPLVGVTSITDPKGNTAYYKYDDFNRLKEVRDDEDRLLGDYKYNYKK